jgi:hypothetical protein
MRWESCTSSNRTTALRATYGSLRQPLKAEVGMRGPQHTNRQMASDVRS